MTRPGAPWWVGLVVVLLGGVAAAVAAVIAFMAGLCSMAHDCTAADNAATVASLLGCLIAFFGAPAAAALATRQWWWSTITIPFPGAYLGYELASGPAVASIYRDAAFLVALSVIDVAVVVSLLAWKSRRWATHGTGEP